MKHILTKAHPYSPKKASLIIRVGLATVLLYAALDGLREPMAWIAYVPGQLGQLTSAQTILLATSVIQIVLAALLLWGKYLIGSAVLTSFLLAGIIITNTSNFLITFRDIGLLAASVSLIFLAE